MKWKVMFSNKALKQTEKFNSDILDPLRLLIENLINQSPSAGNNWPNYGKLHGQKNEDKYHCHIKKGKRTFVCCWEVINKQIKIIEVYYVGTHQNAPY